MATDREVQTITADDVATVDASAIAPAKPVEKFPEIRKMFNALQDERAKITATLDPIRAERDKLVASIAPQEAQIRELGNKIKAIQSGRLFELDNQISALARSMGGRRMSEPPATTGEG